MSAIFPMVATRRKRTGTFRQVQKLESSLTHNLAVRCGEFRTESVLSIPRFHLLTTTLGASALFFYHTLVRWIRVNVPNPTNTEQRICLCAERDDSLDTARPSSLGSQPPGDRPVSWLDSNRPTQQNRSIQSMSRTGVECPFLSGSPSSIT
ncbi:hypothetical protein Pla144_31160 [Bythopirellula polymerisocia]|uniref:Uncharacterized protein n=1 Tax=Bythopirellula polymerisocia TaxID=2528003 RepID=A0A5C6CN92_9BACT|nr:hypothetical protein Pla144_31160 [Bythopirellula polymerisocia]